MDGEQTLARARALLDRAPVFDGHNDLPWVIRQRQAGARRRHRLRSDARPRGWRHRHSAPARGQGRRAILGGVPADQRAASRRAPTLELIDTILRIEAAHPDVFLPARKAADFARARRAGKIASFIVIEGGVGLENSLAPLRIWYAAGARMLIPCHNETLDWVDSATDAPRNGGFNAFGRAVIGECNRLGMIVDGAHVSHDGIRRLLDVTEAPILLSHSNAYHALRPSAQRARRRAEAAEGQWRRRDGDLRAGLRHRRRCAIG